MAPITHVAIRKNGIVYSLSAPNRHHHILWILAKRKGLPDVPEVRDAWLLGEREESGPNSQGFLIEDVYYNRREAQAIVQVFPLIGSVLTSEDLW